MVATVVWLGGLAAFGLIVLPAARRSLSPADLAKLLDGFQRRLDPIGWFSLAVLGGTGLFQMSANPHYAGFLAIENLWSAAILTKHLLFLGMAAISAYLTWGLLPRLRRLALLHSRQAQVDVAESERLEGQELRLLQLNLLLGVMILALTAIARSI